MQGCRRFTILGALLTALLVLALFFNAIGIDPRRLGLSPTASLLLLAASLAGSGINLPVYRAGEPTRAERGTQWISSSPPAAHCTVLTLNLGGGLIPLGVAVYLLGRVPIPPTVAATLVIALLCAACARPLPGRGASIPLILPAVFASGLALALAPSGAASTAFVSGVLGKLAGQAIATARRLRRRVVRAVSIGGADAYDAILLVALLSALMT